MSRFEDEVTRARRALLALDRRSQADVLRAYGQVHRRLVANLADLGRRIAQARQQGVEVRPGWLFAQERYHHLLQDLEQGTIDFAHHAVGTVTTGQQQAVQAAQEAAPRLALAAMGPGPESARKSLLDTFARVPHRALTHVVGYSADGQPLGQLFATLPKQNVTATRDALTFGVATGRPVRLIARDVQHASGTTLKRALGISRTEVIRAHRSSSQERYQAMGLREWTWHAQPDARTCPICWAMHGTVHPASETLASHPMCRCTMVPKTPSWADLGFQGIPDRRPSVPSGESLFRQQPARVQLAILGPTRYRLYRTGQLRLEDLIRPTESRFGPGLRMATLGELATSA